MVDLAPWETPDEEPQQQPDYLGRGRYWGQLTNPAVRDRLIGYTAAEVGGQGRDAEQAFIETTFNRGVARNQDLNQVLSGSYFPNITHRRAMRPVTQAQRDYYGPIIDDVLYGSNKTNYATGNASGTVGFAGGPQTAKFGGERFGVEGPDRNWWTRVSGAGPDLAPWEGGGSTTALPAQSFVEGGSQAPSTRLVPSGGVQQAPWETGAVATPQAPTAAPTVADEEPATAPPMMQGGGDAAPWETAGRTAQPAEEALPKSEPRPVPQPTEFTRGFVSTLAKENPEGFADFLEGMQYNAPESFRPMFQSAAEKMRGLATDFTPEGYERTIKSMYDIKGIGDAFTWAGGAVGSSIASSLPSIITGGLGAGAGALTPIPGGAVIGGLAGAATSSYPLNYAEVYNALKREDVPPNLANKFATVAAVPISALDLASLGFIASRFGGVQAAKKEIVRNLAHRIAVGLAEGAGTEATTETMQDLLGSATVSVATGKPFATMETLKSAVESGVAGGLGGAAMGGAAASISRQRPSQGVPIGEGLPGNPTGSTEVDEIFDLPLAAKPTRGVVTPGGVVPTANSDGEKIPQPTDTDSATTSHNRSVPVEQIITGPGGENRIVVERRAEQPEEPPELYQGTSPFPIYYSQLLKVSEEKLPKKGSFEQIMATLRNQAFQVKKEEIEDIGLEAYLKSLSGPITREQVTDYVRENMIHIVETYNSSTPDNDNNTQYSDYVAPGPYQRYGELRLSVPFNPMQTERGIVPTAATGRPEQRPPFIGTHWGDEENVIFHVQTTSRIDKAGNNTLHLEGIQADWAQRGQKLGFLTDADAREIASLQKSREELKQEYSGLRDKRDDIRSAMGKVQVWKRALFEKGLGTLPAAEGGTMMQKADAAYAQLEGEWNQLSAQMAATRDSIDSASHKIRDLRTTPAATQWGTMEQQEKPAIPPLRTKYTELALRRMYRWAADNGYTRMTVASPEMAILYNTGARGRPQNVADRIKRGLEHYYGKIIPSRLKDLTKYGGVTEKQLIDIGFKYPQLEVREVPGRTDGTTIYQVFDTSENRVITEYYRRDPAEEQIRDRILDTGAGKWAWNAEYDGENRRVYSIYRVNDPHMVTVQQFRTQAEADRYVETQNNAILAEAQSLAGQPQFTEVWGITVPPAARTAVQMGIPLYDREYVPSGDAIQDVTYTPDPRGTTQATPAFIAAVNRAAELFNEYAKKFGFDNKVTLQIQWSELDPDPAYRGSWGLATKFSDGTYKVQVRADYFKGNILGLYSTMMHEFGHVVMWESYSKLPTATKLIIRQAHQDWQKQARANGTYGNLVATRQSAVRFWMARMGTSDATWSKAINSMSSNWINGYALTFDEWFADQVARWATSAEQPLSMVEKAFAGIGKAVRFFLEWMAKKIGVDPRPDLVMQNWLNSVAFGLGPMGAQEYAALDIRTQKQNQYYVGGEGDADVSMPPQQAASGGGRNTMNQVFGGNTPPPIKAMAGHADRMNWFYKYFAGLLELAQVNPRFTPLINFTEHNRQMHNDETRVHDAALRIIKDWRSLGSKQSDALVNFMDDMTNMEYLTQQEKNRGVVRQPTQQEEAQLKSNAGLNARGNAVYLKLKNFFDTFLELNRQNAIVEAMKITDPVERAKKIDEVNAVIRKMKARPYFPFMRFGRHYVTVKNPNGVVLHFETFERKGLVSAERRQQRKAEEMRKQHPNDTVTMGILPESTEPFLGMPGPLLKHIKDKMNLTPSQLDAIEQLQFELSPALSFRHHFQHKNFTPGYSRDFMRAFARYSFHGGRYYARAKHIDTLRDLIKQARLVPDNKANRIADYMSDHLEETILNAKGDYGIFKGGVFFWAMGFVPSAATQNMSQTPLVTFPYLASKFGGLGLGEARASKALLRAMTTLTNFYRRGSYDGKNLNQDWEMRAISYGIKTGRVTETQAPEIAGIAQGNNLMFGAGGSELQRWSNWALEKSASFFELAEQWNRRIAWRATLELAMAHNNAPIVQEAVSRYPSEYNELVGREGFTPSQARAILTAAHVVESTQLVYARYARPRFMRGRLAGTVLIFKRFIQGMALLGINNPGFLWRYVLLMMLMGGMGGIPGYEDLKSIVQGLLRWLGHNVDAEVELRKLIMAYVDPNKLPPDLILHGLSRRGYGLPALTDMLGSYVTGRPGRGFDATTSGKNVPFPQLDRSKAVGTVGPYIPLEIGKLIDPSQDLDKALAEQGQKAAGAVFSVAFNIYRALMDKDLDARDWKRWEKAVPRMLGATSKAYRTYNEGRERSGPQEAGATIVNYDVRDTEQLMEIIAMGMGYNNLRASSKWDQIIAQNEHIKYVDFERSTLLAQYYEALKGGDKPELDKVKDRIIDFNTRIAGTEDRGKRITPDSLKRSLQGRERERIARERGVPVQKTNIPIAREIQDLFPETTIDVRRIR